MNYLSLDYLIVYAFLLITLIIGIRAGKGIKDIREYAIANKSFGTGALVLTYLATNIAGASVINGPARVFSNGIIPSVALLGLVIAFVIRALFIAPKAVHFDNCITMGDLMKTLYGEYSGLIAGVLGLLTAVCLAGMELVVFGIVCETLLGIQPAWAIIAGGVILAIYSAHGGIKSVTATDVFQFLVLFAVLPFIAGLAIDKVGSIKEIFMQAPAEKLVVFGHENFSYYLTLFLIWSILPLGVIDPAIIQRLLMGKTGRQLRNQYLIIAAFDPVFRLTIMILGLAGLILYPSLEAKNLVPHIIQDLLPVGLKGLAMAGILAVCMSTIDSYLHAAGLTLIHDVVKPICDKSKVVIHELTWTRYATVLIGAIAIGIGLTATNIFSLLLNSLAFTGPLLMFPLLSGIMGLKTDKVSFYTALFVTLFAFLITKQILPKEISHLSMLITTLVNGITFFISHFIQNKGFAIINRNKGTELVWKPGRKSFFKNFHLNLPIYKYIIQYSQMKVAKYGASYTLFGVFFGLNFIFPYFMASHTATFYYNYTLVATLRLLGAMLCGLLIVKEKWPMWLRGYMPTYWHITILYCLPFMSTMMFLLTQGSTEWLINIMAVIILLFILLDWSTALFLGVLGITLGLLFYRQVIGPINLTLDFSAGYLLAYQTIFGLLIGLLFARRRQQRFDRLATDHQALNAADQENQKTLLETFKEKARLLKTLKQAGIQDLAHVVELVKELRSKSQVSQPINSIIQQLENTVTPMAVALERIENRATDYLRLDMQPVAINKLLEEVQEQCHPQPIYYKLNTQHQEIICDPIYIKKMLANSMAALQTVANKKQPIWVALHETQLNYPLYSLKRDYIKQVPAMAFTIANQQTMPPIDTAYEAQMNGSALPMPETPQELLLITNQRIVKAHYGYTNINAETLKTTDHYLYVIPMNLSEVRPKDMNDPYMELGAELTRADDTYPGASKQEQDFLTAVQQQTSSSIEAIQTALEMIKWYHGPKNRHSGEPFYLHPLAVAQIVLTYNQDQATILGALLHDTVEDTPMLLENIAMIFGTEVARIVDGVTHFESTKESFYKVKLAAHENILMLLEIEDKRALYVKIADRMHNMRTIGGHRSDDKKKKITEETLQFFVPLAKELGLEQAASEFKEISMAVLSQVAKKNSMPSKSIK